MKLLPSISNNGPMSSAPPPLKLGDVAGSEFAGEEEEASHAAGDKGKALVKISQVTQCFGQGVTCIEASEHGE